LGQDRRGSKEGIESLNAEIIHAHYRRLFAPRGTILSVAGNVRWHELKTQVERLFCDWDGPEPPPLKVGKRPARRAHLSKETQQTQIAIAYPSVPIGRPDYYAALGAVNVLSGGMSARLFTEVREKRGLCYAVWATYSTFKDRASVLCYAGTTNERAQETLDVTLGELRRLQEGISGDEVERVQAGLKSSLIMQEESTSARAGTLASDWYYLGRVRTPEEIHESVESLTPRKITNHLRRCPPRDFTIVTLGPKALRLKSNLVAV
jgi:predicted Zn-dependent peptidase